MRWPALPPVATKHELVGRRLYLISTSILYVWLLAFLTAGLTGPQNPLRSVPWAILLFLAILAGILGFIFWGRSRRKGRTVVLRCRFLICPACRYRLDGLPAQGACPECGRLYTHTALEELWMRRYSILPEDQA